MAILGVDDFKSKLNGGGARPNLFKATINFPAYAGGDVEFTSFMVKGAGLPASVIANIDVPFRGRQLKVAGDRTFEPWTITVINDQEMNVRNAFETWMNAIANHADIGGTQNPELYFTDLQVKQFDRDETIKKIYNFKDAWPVNVSAIDLSYGDVDTIERFSVTWQYQYWTSNTTDGVSSTTAVVA